MSSAKHVSRIRNPAFQGTPHTPHAMLRTTRTPHVLSALPGCQPQRRTFPNPGRPALDAQASISAAIGRDQAAYHVAARPAGLPLANPANQFNASLQSGILQLSSGADTWKMSLAGIGYGGTMQAVGAASVTAADNRVDCNYGSIDAWYINGPQGLEQGFTLAPSPQLASSVKSGLLTVQLAWAET